MRKRFASAGVAPAATAPGGRFYIYPQLLDEAMAVRRCFRSRANLHNRSRTQYLFELDALDADHNGMLELEEGSA